jgi:hypothetical protein
MRIGLHGVVRRVWAPRGVKVRQRRQIVYRWTYLAIGVDGVRGELHWAWLPNMKKEPMAELARSWRREGVAGIVWDGASSHRARVVREVGPALIGLPPSAPELNPAERVIEEMRARIEGRVYVDLEAKRAAAEVVLEELAADPERIRRLAGWTWIREADAQLAAAK